MSARRTVNKHIAGRARLGGKPGRAGTHGPMPSKVLITGGAGFVGSHLADELLRQGRQVRILDSLSPQVHGAGQNPPAYLNREAELIVADIRDRSAVEKALAGVECVFHLAAAVGVGQSMYQIVDYTQTNCEGTAVLLELLSRSRVERLVVASSMSIYGEGHYVSPEGGIVEGSERPLEQIQRHDWEIRAADGTPLRPAPTRESKRPGLPSVYSISKYHQETLCLNVCRAYGIAATALRFFNIYGTRQSLSNPYTGVLAIFASRYLNGKPPLINEDGQQRRDFIHVRDVARACRMAAESPQAAGKALNIGSGRDYSILQIAREMACVLGKETIVPEVTEKYRMGDIRHCFADITLARETLGFEPEIPLHDGLAELAQWLEGQHPVDNVPQAQRELARHGLSV